MSDKKRCKKFLGKVAVSLSTIPIRLRSFDSEHDGQVTSTNYKYKLLVSTPSRACQLFNRPVAMKVANMCDYM